MVLCCMVLRIPGIPVYSRYSFDGERVSVLYFYIFRRVYIVGVYIGKRRVLLVGYEHTSMRVKK